MRDSLATKRIEAALDSESLPIENPNFLRSPYGAYSQLRAQSPIVPSSDGHTWYVLSYHVAKEVLTRRDFGKGQDNDSSTESESLLRNALAYWPLLSDPPNHIKYRQLACSHGRRDFESLVSEVVQRTFSRLRSAGPIEVNEFLVVPLVDEVIGQISGLAAKDREDVFPLVERITDGLLNNKNAAKWALAEAAYEEILEWLRMKSRLKDAAVGGGSINIEAQLVGASLFTMMIFAGRDALRYGLTSVIKNVIDHPGLHLALRNSDVMKSFVKEVLRVDPPIQYTWRRALADVDLQGNKIKRGDFIAVILGSANRDEAVFQKADSVVLGRCGETPLTFGAGIHYCIGASIVTEVAGCVLKCLLDNDVLSNAVILEEEVHARPPFKGISKLSISLTNP